MTHLFYIKRRLITFDKHTCFLREIPKHLRKKKKPLQCDAMVCIIDAIKMIMPPKMHY